ncbi:MAG: hypothetical protein AAGC74_05930 [Verrucomicrobiota bacterium]
MKGGYAYTKLGLSGRGWLLEGEKKETIVGAGFARSELGTDWVEVDFGEDFEKAKAWLGEGVLEEAEGEWEYSRRPTEGGLLALALQAYEAGYREEGQALADEVIRVTPGGENLVDDLVGGVADGRLGLLTRAFCEEGMSRDAYREGLQQLIREFPRGWENLVGVLRLSGLLEEEDFELSAPEGIEFGDEVFQYFRGIVEGKEEFDLGWGELEWLFQEGDSGEGFARFGREGLLGLALASGEEVLTRQVRSEDEDGELRRRVSFSYGVEDNEKSWRGMNRPLTLGEIVGPVLRGIFPGEGYEDLEGELLREEGILFWKAHRKKTGEELALLYLGEGTVSQVAVALEWLVEVGAEGALSQFEEMILNDPDLVRWAGAVGVYVRKRKEQAAEFWSKLRPEWEEELESLGQRDVYAQEFRALANYGSGSGYLKMLDGAARNAPPTEVLREVAQEEDMEVVRDAFRAIRPVMENLSAEERAGLFLDVLKVEDGTIYQAMILSSLAYGELGDGKKLLEGREELWEGLLAIQEPLPDSLSGWQMKHIGGMAAYLLESSFEEDGVLGLRDFWQRLGDSFWDVVLSRAQARVAGKPVPVWPDAGEVDKKARAELVERFGGSEAIERVKLFEDFSSSELMAWSEMLETWKEESMPDWMAENWAKIVRVDEGEEGQELSRLGVEEGSIVDGAWLKMMVEKLPQAENLIGLLIRAGDLAGGLGREVSLMSLDDSELGWMKNFLSSLDEEVGEKGVLALWCYSDRYLQLQLRDGQLDEEEEVWVQIHEVMEKFGKQGSDGGEDWEPMMVMMIWLTPEILSEMKEEALEEE